LVVGCVLLSSMCPTPIALAQTGWWKTYGGPYNDNGTSGQQTTDGGYIVAGWTEGFGPGSYSVYLIKTNTSGDTLWTRTCGGPQDDVGFSVQQTADGYIIAGWTRSFGAENKDVCLIKTDASGDTTWTRTYGGPGDDGGYSVQQTSDGGFVIAGYTYSFGAGSSGAYLVKTNSTGDTLWTRTYGGTRDDVGYSAQQTTDGGYVIAGRTQSVGAGNEDVYLIKTNTSGDTLWTRTYGGTDYDGGRSVQQTADGGYIITGYTHSSGAGSGDVYLIKTNASGDTLWTRAYGGTGVEWGYDVQQTTDGGYIIVGCTQSFGAGIDDVYLIKTNASGDPVWARTYGGADDDVGNSVQQATDGGYVIAGYTGPFGPGNQDVYLIRTNASGDTLWTKTYGGLDSDEGYSVRQTTDGGYVVAGYAKSFGAGNADVYLIKSDANGNVVGIEEPWTRNAANPTRLLVQPNPFASFARVPGHEADVFALLDVTGRQVATCRGDRVGEGLRPGVYFLSPIGSRTDKAVTATTIKAAF